MKGGKKKTFNEESLQKSVLKFFCVKSLLISTDDSFNVT